MMLAFAIPVRAQDFPTKPVRLVTSGVGSTGDVNSRLYATGLSAALGVSVVVDNRTAGIVPVEVVAKAPPDGHTLLAFGSVVWLAGYMQDNVPFEPFRDFAPIMLGTYAPNLLVIHPAMPVRSVKELIALAKSRPGIMNYGSSGAGSSSHLAGELFKSMAGVNVVRINYKSLAHAYNDLITGEVQFMFATAASVMPYIKSGQLKMLAVTGAQPSPLYPGTPTVAATGLPGYESGSRSCLFAPAKTPEAIVRKLHLEMARYLRMPETREKFHNASLEVVASTPEQLVAIMKSEMARMGALIKAIGIRSQ